jgi:hypothetical protein
MRQGGLAAVLAYEAGAFLSRSSNQARSLYER